MKTFKSKKQTGRHDIFVSEVKLKKTDAKRTALVNKLFKLIGEEANATIL